MSKQEFIDRIYECGRSLIEGFSAEEKASVDAMLTRGDVELDTVGIAFSNSVWYEMRRTEGFRSTSKTQEGFK